MSSLETFAKWIAATSLLLANTACSSPVIPTAIVPADERTLGFDAPSASGNSLTAHRVVASLSLVNGSFTLKFKTPDGFAGTATGSASGSVAVANPGNTAASINFRVDPGSSGISAIQGEGTGAFNGDGVFNLTLAITSTTLKSSDGSVVKATLKGTAVLSCKDGHVIVTHRGSGSTSRLAEITLDMRHELAGAGCS